MAKKLKYEEAFFKILEEISKREMEEGGLKENLEGFVECVFNVLGELEDEKSTMKFAASIVDETGDIICQDEVLTWAIELLKKKALESVGITEKPEVPTEESKPEPEFGPGSG